MRSITLLALVAVVFSSHLCSQVPALTTVVAGNSVNGVDSPIFVCAPPGDLTRLFVVQKTGAIKVRTPATAGGNWGTFLDVHALVTNGGEQGLLGLAFHPNYAANGYFFIDYTDTSGNTVIARYQVSANPDVANAASGTTVLTIIQPEANHNGGCLQFGPDGYLYASSGDGGGGNDQHGTFGNGQNLDTMLGKMLRIDVNALPYTSPPTNPFYGATAGLDEIWAYGLRNPWRFSFDRLTGDMYIGDVGQGTQEEIDFQPATNASGAYGGRNYGWRCREGTFCTGLSGCTCPSAALTDPIITAPTPTAAAIMGGYVYRGCAVPQLRGWYFYGYYGTGSIFRLVYDGATVTSGPVSAGFTVSGVVSFGEDGNGELYACALSAGTVYKIVPVTPQLVGVTSYGTGTPGCTGASVLSLACSPTLFNPGETINSTNGAPVTTGVGILGTVALPAGSDPFGIMVETLVDLTPSYFLFQFPVAANGTASFPIGIPNTPGLVGSTFYTQEFFLWSTCSPSPLSLSSTQALSITIQP